MPLMTAYHRPTTVDEALDLIAKPDHVALAGGTVLNADRQRSDLIAVDLQNLGLAEITAAGSTIEIGAMVTLDRVMAEEAMPALVRQMAQAELPSSLRTLATVGGTIAVGTSDSVLVAALLAYGAKVSLAKGGTMSLAECLAADLSGDLIVSITVAVDGDGAYAATGRTPADTPIVAALGRQAGEGTTLVLTGVADHPVSVSPDDPVAGLNPPSDFRGSASYRRELATVLARRVLEELGS